MQSSNNIFLVKPAHFIYNIETSQSNTFQTKLSQDREISKQNAILEFENMTEKLLAKGINVAVINDLESLIKPDAIFPNNWVTLHSDGTVILYPMLASNRRQERRKDIIEWIREKFKIRNLIDLSKNEKENRFLEGTGSMIFDHDNKFAYACLSPRTNKELFIETCELMGYKPIYFHSIGQNGIEIYHTNVMMMIGNGFSVICLESILDEKEKEQVIHFLTNSEHHIIDITYSQMSSFCGNMLELEIPNKKNILVMSQTAYGAFSSNQKRMLEGFCELFPLNINTIEQIGGGGVRCMIAEIFLPLKE